MSRTENRYGQATIPPGADRDGLIDAVYAAIEDALTFTYEYSFGVEHVLYDQVQLSSEIVKTDHMTVDRCHTEERNVLTVRLPVVFDE